MSQISFHAVRAAEAPMLDFMSEAEEPGAVAAQLAQLFMEGQHAGCADAAGWQLPLAILLSISQLAAPLLQHLCADEDFALAQVRPS